MGRSYATTLNFWPASPLPSSIAYELQLIGVNVQKLKAANGHITPHRTRDGQLGLELNLYDSYYGLTGIEGVLATLRLGRVNYTAWDSSGAGRSFNPTEGEEQTFAVLADGEAVITAGDLDSLAHNGSAEAIVEQLHRKLRRLTPPFTETVAPQQVTLTICEDDLFDSEPELVADAEPPS